MTLITRVSKLFTADIHAVLDRLEEPDLVLRQAVREMEEELALDRQRVTVVREELRRLDARNGEVERSLAGVEEELEVCLDAGEDDLARALIRRRLEAQRFRDFMADKRRSLTDTLAQLENRVQENGQRLDAMRQKAELLAAEESPVSLDDRWSSPNFSVRQEDVEIDLLREKQRRQRT